MLFEARNTKLTVFSLNHELYNLIKSEFQHKNRFEELIDKFPKACIVLYGLNKSFLR